MAPPAGKTRNTRSASGAAVSNSTTKSSYVAGRGEIGCGDIQPANPLPGAPAVYVNRGSPAILAGLAELKGEDGAVAPGHELRVRPIDQGRNRSLRLV